MDLQGKVAIVTGGATGFGKEISLKLAKAGANVAVVYSKSEREASETVGELRDLGVTASAFKADVGIESEIVRMVADVVREFGRIDVLVNDAGATVYAPMSDLNAISDADWDRVLAVNLKSHFFTAREVAPHMQAVGAGVIVNITSIAGLRPAGSSMVYCVSKAGAIMLAKCLATGLAPTIRVNSVAPGFLGTRWLGGFTDEQIESFKAAALLNKLTPLGDAADGVMFAVTNDSITGQTLVVDAGIWFH
jgi:3-oxoacyl-[acyl-carrier protein] reductase